MLSDPWILRSAILIRSKLYYDIQSVFCSIWLLSYSCYTDIHIPYIATVVQYGCIVIECYWYPIYYELPISITLLLWYWLFISTILIIHIPYDNSYSIVIVIRIFISHHVTVIRSFAGALWKAPFHLTASRADLHRSPENLRRRNAVAPAFIKACQAGGFTRNDDNTVWNTMNITMKYHTYFGLTLFNDDTVWNGLTMKYHDA